MQTVFLLCIGVGGVVLLAQVVLDMVGAGLDVPELDLPDPDLGGSDLSTGLELLSVRSLAAGMAVFGAFGLWLDGFLFGPIAAGLALLPGFGAVAATAWLTRFMLRAESSGSLRLEDAVGALGTVYLPVPGAASGTGLVQFPLQGRTVELRARTPEEAALPSGAKVLVISVDTENETVEVVSTSNIEGLE